MSSTRGRHNHITEDVHTEVSKAGILIPGTNMWRSHPHTKGQRQHWRWGAELFADFESAAELTWTSLSMWASSTPLCLFAWGGETPLLMQGRRGEEWRREEKSSSVYLQQNHQESLKVAAGVATDVLLQVVVVLWETHGARTSVPWLVLRQHQCDKHRDLRKSQTQEVTMNCIVIVTPVIWQFLFLLLHMPCNNIR